MPHSVLAHRARETIKMLQHEPPWPQSSWLPRFLFI